MSIIIGLITGLLLTYFLKQTEKLKEFPIRETSLIFLTGYFTYIISEVLHYSGTMSLFASAMIISHYAYQNIS